MPQDTQARRIMVVDDEPANLLLVAEVMRLFGDSPVTYDNSDDAWEALQSDSFDLIFMDVHMPGRSGLELTRQLRELEARLGRQPTPVVALTASAMPDEQAACLANGMNDVMTKPFQFDALRAMIDRWCSGVR